MDIQNFIQQTKDDCEAYKEANGVYPNRIAMTTSVYCKIFGKQKLRKTNQTLLSQSLPTIVIWE